MLLDIEKKIEEENQQIRSADVNKRKKNLIDVDKGQKILIDLNCDCLLIYTVYIFI